MKLKIDIKQEAIGILNYKDSFLCVGSCFSENIGVKFQQLALKSLYNPFGILYQPISILNCLKRINSKTVYGLNDLVNLNDIWHSFDHHGSYSSLEPKNTIEKINSDLKNAHQILNSSTTLLITLGTSFVYELKSNNKVVANCHKFPSSNFSKRMLSVQEITVALKEIRNLFPEQKIVYTISPVRHIKDGVLENQRSKARLLEAINNVCDRKRTFYFYAYEIMIDELRDYRFYKKDLVHPNQVAIDYIWESFVRYCFDATSQEFIKERESIIKDMNHRSLFPGSEADEKFIAQLENKKKQHQKKWNFEL